MDSTTKIKSVDFYRKIPRDLTEASLSGAGLSIVAALFAMVFLFGMHRLNITKTITKVPIDSHLRATGEEFHSASGLHLINHGDEDHEENSSYAAIPLTEATFEKFSHHFQIWTK